MTVPPSREWGCAVCIACTETAMMMKKKRGDSTDYHSERVSDIYNACARAYRKRHSLYRRGTMRIAVSAFLLLVGLVVVSMAAYTNPNRNNDPRIDRENGHWPVSESGKPLSDAEVTARRMHSHLHRRNARSDYARPDHARKFVSRLRGAGDTQAARESIMERRRNLRSTRRRK